MYPNYIIDINSTFTDTMRAQALNQASAPVQNVPVNFELATPNIGYISTDLAFTDSLGYAYVIYNIEDTEIEVGNNRSENIQFNAFVNENLLIQYWHQILL